MSKRRNIIKYHKKIDFNVGTLVFLLILVYMVISIIMYATSKKTRIYEVNVGTLSLDNVYTGLIIRDESIIKSDYSGTVNYFLANKSVADATSVIYTVDETGHVSELLNNYIDSSLDYDDLSEIKNLISDYSLEYSDSNFSSIYELKNKITNKLNSYHYNIVLEELDKIIEDSGNTTLFHKVTSNRTGIVLFTVDGYENISEETISADYYNPENIINKSLLEETIINKGDNAFRLINSDMWNIYIPLDDSEIAALSGKKNVKIRFVDSGLICTANFSVIKGLDGNYGKLSLSKYLINYADVRYVNIELIETSYSGLKIPLTSVFEKSFYTIPLEYITKSNNFVRISYTKNGEMLTESVNANIYGSDDKYYYVSMDDFSSGDIIMNDKGQQYIIGTMGELAGVYCVNKGYAIFKEVDILDKNNEYYIVRKGTNYGLKIYDHIVLDYKSVDEHELIN